MLCEHLVKLIYMFHLRWWLSELRILLHPKAQLTTVGNTLHEYVCANSMLRPTCPKPLLSIRLDVYNK